MKTPGIGDAPVDRMRDLPREDWSGARPRKAKAPRQARPRSATIVAAPGPDVLPHPERLKPEELRRIGEAAQLGFACSRLFRPSEDRRDHLNRKSSTIRFRVDPETDEHIRAIAKLTGATVTDICRTALQGAVAEVLCVELVERWAAVAAEFGPDSPQAMMIRRNYEVLKRLPYEPWLACSLLSNPAEHQPSAPEHAQ